MNPGSFDIGILTAFIAGLIAFLSPCVLPLMPGYLSIITKLSYEDLTSDEDISRFSSIILPSIIFVLGFSTVFILLGAFSSQVGIFLTTNKVLLLKIIGILIIIFGIFSMEIIKIPQLYGEKRVGFPHNNKGFFSTYLLGIAFGFAWTPCVGPILASILLYASTTENSITGAYLLMIYSLGLGVPFLLMGLAFSKALITFKIIRKYYNFYKFIVGGALILIGILMLTNNLYQLNIYGQKVMDFLGIDFWKTF
ncbi:MAG: cytochrome c biogenesis protein CcdA [Candidatus Dadabacteria bacterium]|nr:cytochrome c biogenesis protein CcdA [Candidatus Dadabacteria bacterium]NIQ16354.1 cytochrome c biogenesis protein CcdA [Candidatus Dadabacteria bacterium]